ncbi:hypothetical protein SO802_005158 [Lithocarpus litseifolius]|uniref:Response regulatory domain-containing protein n=1 Tax=Lithocarpus litseifolius TaxID=425828 RepID=A0AAW2DHF0_9ROSI
MFHKKNNGSALLRESDTTLNNFPLGLSVLIVDHDQQSMQEMEANLRRCGYEVAKYVRVEDASTLLRMEGSAFHIIIIEQCLLGVNEFEILRIGREMDLPVIVTSEDGEPDIVQRSLNYGACDYLLKPIPMSVLKMVWKYMFLKKVTNNVSRVRNQRMSWTRDSHEKFVESVQKLGGADKATPKGILKFLQSNFKGFEDVILAKIASHLQVIVILIVSLIDFSPACAIYLNLNNHIRIMIINKYRESCKNTNLPTIGGSTCCGNQSDALKTQIDEILPSEQKWNEFMRGGDPGFFSINAQPIVNESFLNDIDASPNGIPILDEYSSLDAFQGGISGDPGFFTINAQPFVNESFLNDIDASPNGIPILDEYSSLNTYKGGISGDPGFFSINAQPFVNESFLNDIDAALNGIPILDEYSSLDAFQGGISGDPGFFPINAPLLSPLLSLHIDHGEHGCFPDGIAENFTGDVTAREHYNNL